MGEIYVFRVSLSRCDFNMLSQCCGFVDRDLIQFSSCSYFCARQQSRWIRFKRHRRNGGWNLDPHSQMSKLLLPFVFFFLYIQHSLDDLHLGYILLIFNYNNFYVKMFTYVVCFSAFFKKKISTRFCDFLIYLFFIIKKLHYLFYGANLRSEI